MKNDKLFSLLVDSHCGCGAKLPPWELEDLLKETFQDKISVSLPFHSSLGTWEDVAAMDINGQTIIQNIDIITPPTDDPFSFGKISVANALSDIYAKGGKPLFAMDFLGFPFTEAPIEWAKDILLGGLEALKTASVALLGGHTIDDKEPKFGLSVVGTVEKGEFISNSTVNVGDCLILTKPLGSGIIITAMYLSKDSVSQEIASRCINIMEMLNKDASEIMKIHGVNACTDVTGFGLAGHLSEMIEPGKFTALLHFDAIPVIGGAFNYLNQGFFTPVVHKTEDYLQIYKNMISFKGKPNEQHAILFDPQTSGGLLISVSKEKSSSLLEDLKNNNISAEIIGEIIDQSDKPQIIIE